MDLLNLLQGWEEDQVDKSKEGFCQVKWLGDQEDLSGQIASNQQGRFSELVH